MARLRQLDRRIAEIAAAIVRADQHRRPGDPVEQLSRRIAGIGSFDVAPDLVDRRSGAIEALDDQVVFRTEMTIERHLIGAGRLGDGVDADAADAVAMKHVLRGDDDALARPGGRGA